MKIKELQKIINKMVYNTLYYIYKLIFDFNIFYLKLYLFYF